MSEDKSRIKYNVPYLFSNDAAIEEKEIPVERDWDAEDEFDKDPTYTFDEDEFEDEEEDEQATEAS